MQPDQGAHCLLLARVAPSLSPSAAAIAARPSDNDDNDNENDNDDDEDSNDDDKEDDNNDDVNDNDRVWMRMRPHWMRRIAVLCGVPNEIVRPGRASSSIGAVTFSLDLGRPGKAGSHNWVV